MDTITLIAGFLRQHGENELAENVENCESLRRETRITTDLEFLLNISRGCVTVETLANRSAMIKEHNMASTIDKFVIHPVFFGRRRALENEFLLEMFRDIDTKVDYLGLVPVTSKRYRMSVCHKQPYQHLYLKRIFPADQKLKGLAPDSPPAMGYARLSNPYMDYYKGETGFARQIILGHKIEKIQSRDFEPHNIPEKKGLGLATRGTIAAAEAADPYPKVPVPTMSASEKQVLSRKITPRALKEFIELKRRIIRLLTQRVAPEADVTVKLLDVLGSFKGLVESVPTDDGVPLWTFDWGSAVYFSEHNIGSAASDLNARYIRPQSKAISKRAGSRIITMRAQPSAESPDPGPEQQYVVERSSHYPNVFFMRKSRAYSQAFQALVPSAAPVTLLQSALNASKRIGPLEEDTSDTTTLNSLAAIPTAASSLQTTMGQQLSSTLQESQGIFGLSSTNPLQVPSQVQPKMGVLASKIRNQHSLSAEESRMQASTKENKDSMKFRVVQNATPSTTKVESVNYRDLIMEHLSSPQATIEAKLQSALTADERQKFDSTVRSFAEKLRAKELSYSSILSNLFDGLSAPSGSQVQGSGRPGSNYGQSTSSLPTGIEQFSSRGDSDTRTDPSDHDFDSDMALSGNEEYEDINLGDEDQAQFAASAGQVSIGNSVSMDSMIRTTNEFIKATSASGLSEQIESSAQSLQSTGSLHRSDVHSSSVGALGHVGAHHIRPQSSKAVSSISSAMNMATSLYSQTQLSTGAPTQTASKNGSSDAPAVVYTPVPPMADDITKSCLRLEISVTSMDVAEAGGTAMSGKDEKVFQSSVPLLPVTAYCDINAVIDTAVSGLDASDAKNSAKDKYKTILQVIRGQLDQTSLMNTTACSKLPIYYNPLHTGAIEVTTPDDADVPFIEGETILNRYKLLKMVGSATFSNVFSCLDLKDNVTYCLKIIKQEKEFFDQAIDEVHLLELLKDIDPNNNINIIKIHDYFYFREHLLLKFTLLGEDLYTHFNRREKKGQPNDYTIPVIRDMARQVLKALDYIHRLGITHLDLKPENLLHGDKNFIGGVNEPSVTLVDFGSSSFIFDKMHSYIQSRSYRAPEVILATPYDSRADIWSFGCVVCELLTGRVLFPNYSVATILSRICSLIGPIPRDMIMSGRMGQRVLTFGLVPYEHDEKNRQHFYFTPQQGLLEYWLFGERCANLTDEEVLFSDFCRQALIVDPIKRPTAAMLLEHPFIKGADLLL
ncbi:Kinase, CMGC DYRK [Giardia duodenalis]|uniref:Kinase, CMGC DYRK n=1 Tax=Giardia intestinalis (strain ATCC 50803 / WB clone C6) TaxID=184922 RepID=A8BU04_GIAIC|nr:Kinase, CMGC DYRK [Giardia intestinalis]KAE8304588.1 Kinase, CMGC DYRK [Giardia intestinalis]|eukprot:XP_001704788.1 Kinase, CMGC DYRK [Giardia lamblia ATCC 50803]